MEQQPPRDEESAKILPFSLSHEQVEDSDEDMAAARELKALLRKYKDPIERLSEYQRKTFLDSIYQWPEGVPFDEEYIRYALEEADTRPHELSRKVGGVGLRLVAENSDEQLAREASKRRHPSNRGNTSPQPLKGEIKKDYGDLPDGVIPGDFGARPARYGRRVRRLQGDTDNNE